MKDETKVTLSLAVILLIYLLIIAFWIAVIWAAIHFILKFW